MRLLCPNCGAQYEVDGSMIPDEGRDVQCSNCGQTWFQEPEEVDLGLAPEPRAVPEPEPQPEPEPPVHEPEVAPDETPVAREAAAFKAATASAPEPPSAPATGIDENVLGILREEAEREIDARRAEGIETQTELGLTEGSDPGARRKDLRERMAALRDEDDLDSEEEISPEPNGPRSGLLPDIEEINSSLSPAEDSAPMAPPVDPEAEEAARRSGFRIGFMLMMLLAILLVAAYAYAPMIARAVPAAEPIVIVYVDLANSARAGIDDAMARSAASLSGLIGETE